MNRITRVRAALVLVAAVAGIVAATAAARTDSGAAKPPIVIGAVVDLTKNMAPFDAPALLAAQLQIKAINAKGGVNGRKLKMVFLNDQLDPAQDEAVRPSDAAEEGRHRLGHVRRQLRSARGAGVPERRQAHHRAVPRHGRVEPDPFRVEGQARLLVRQRGSGRGRCRGGVLLQDEGLADGGRRHRQPAPLLPGRLQGVHGPLHAARRQDRLAGGVHAG